MDRRKFFGMSGSALVAALAACNARGPRAAQRVLSFAKRKNQDVGQALFRHTRMDIANASAPLAGNAMPHYFVSRTVPTWDVGARGQWHLEVSGAVRKPLTLTLDQLKSLPSITHRVNHYCVEGWTAVVEWTGVKMSTLANLVELTDEARFVDFQSFDSDYHESWDMASALHAQTVIAYGYGGQDLNPGRGAPARLHSPVKLGYKSVKYLTKIVFMPDQNGGYWTDRGYEWYAGT